MSTIDIGVAEAPALPATRVLSPNLARPTYAHQVMPAPIHVDFYVGSTKIEALPLANTATGTAPALPTR